MSPFTSPFTMRPLSSGRWKRWVANSKALAGVTWATVRTATVL